MTEKESVTLQQGFTLLTYFLLFKNYSFIFKQLYCPNGIPPMGNLGCTCILQGKQVATESHYLTYGACWVFYCFYNPPNSDMDYKIFNMRTNVT